MPIREREQIVLTSDLPALGLKCGDIGTVVHVHPSGAGFEVEFMTLDGETIGVETLAAESVRPVAAHEIAHARRVA
jgi:hypothetical protein